MDYLNNTIVFLQQENKELKERLKRIEDLQSILNQQRTHEQKEYLARLHQEEINVIREMAADKENQLKQQIKQLKAEVQQLTQNVIKEEDRIMQLKRDLQQSKLQNEDLCSLNQKMQQQVAQLEQRLRQISDDHAVSFERLRNQYQARQDEVIRKYLEKLDAYTEKHEDQIIVKEKVIHGLNRKVENAHQQKALLEEELQNLMRALREGEAKKTNKQIQAKQEKDSLRMENQQLMLNLKQIQIQLFETQELLKDAKKQNKNLEEEVARLRRTIGELQNTSKKQIERQKSKTISVCKNLAQHQKYLKGQAEVSKRKEMEFTQSKKLLLNKIRQMEGKPSSCKSNNTSFIDKTTAKTAKRANFESHQSVSLDNSFSKDSPSVSCFLNDQKINSRGQQGKKPLTIDTSSYNTLLRFESIDTPCFQSAKEVTKKTIKIKK